MAKRIFSVLALAPFLAWAQESVADSSSLAAPSALVPAQAPPHTAACPHPCGTGCCQTNQICHTGFRIGGQTPHTCLDRPSQYEEQQKIKQAIKKMKITTHLPINVETVKEAATEAGARTTEAGMGRIKEIVKEVVAEDATKTATETGQYSDARLDQAVGDALSKAGFNVSTAVVDEAREKVRAAVKTEEGEKVIVQQVVAAEATVNADAEEEGRGAGEEKVDALKVEADLKKKGFNITDPLVKNAEQKEVFALAARRGLRKACQERQLDTKSIYSAVEEALKKANVDVDEHVMAEAMAAIRPLREHLTHKLREKADTKVQANADSLFGAPCGLRTCEESCATATTQKDCGVRYQECFVVVTNDTDSTPKCSETGAAGAATKDKVELSPACLADMAKVCPGMGGKGQPCFDCIHAHHTELSAVCAGSHSGNQFCEASDSLNVTCSWHNEECVARPTDLCPVTVVEVAPNGAAVNATEEDTIESSGNAASWTVVLTDEEIISVLDAAAATAQAKKEEAKELGEKLAAEAREKNVNRRTQTEVSLKARLINKIPLAKEDPDLVNTAVEAARKYIATAPPSAAVVEKKEAVADYEKRLNISPDGEDGLA